ncbi:tape measure protein [Aurantimonas sp. A2-1-M11]|uniref:tape measure protein n=1 Tax=Aurantimonas sp. A2-1-M11 TaxID=3113712 RepID=UPI002F940680
MATDIEQLVVRIDANINGMRKQMGKAEQVTNRSFGRIESRAKRMSASLNSTFAGMGTRLIGAFAGVAAVRSASELVDASIRIQNALKVTGLAGEELTKVYDSLFASAQRNYAPLETLTTLYSRLGLAQSELGVTTGEILNFTDKIGLALRVQGTSAAEARGALIQLTQALGGGVVRAEEFNSILEGAPTIARAAAAGLEEAGGSVAKLRSLVINGEVSSQAFFRAFEAGAGILEGQVANAEQTVSQGFVRLQNVLIDTAGELNEGSDASERLAGVLDTLADIVESTDFSPVINGIINVGDAAVSVIGSITSLASEIGRLSGIQDAFQNRISRDELSKNFKEQIRTQLGGGNERIEDAFDLTRGTGEGLAERGGRVAPKPAPVITPVSLSDYVAPAKPVGGGGGRGRSGGRSRGGGGGGGGSGSNDYEREIRQIKERTAALQSETVAMAGLNPLLEDYGFAKEKITSTQELLTAAEREGIKVTPEIRASIESLAEGYAAASAEAEKLAESQDKARETAQDMRDLGKDITGGFISDLRNGASAADALSNALSKVADKLLDIALNSLFSSGGGGGFGGGIGGIISSIFGGFRASGGPVSSGKAYVVGERGPELMVPSSAGTVIPNGAMGGGGGRNVHVTVGVDVDKSGNLTPFVTSISDQRAQIRSQQAMQQSASQFPQLQQDRQRRKG